MEKLITYPLATLLGLFILLLWVIRADKWLGRA